MGSMPSFREKQTQNRPDIKPATSTDKTHQVGPLLAYLVRLYKAYKVYQLSLTYGFQLQSRVQFMLRDSVFNGGTCLEQRVVTPRHQVTG